MKSVFTPEHDGLSQARESGKGPSVRKSAERPSPGQGRTRSQAVYENLRRYTRYAAHGRNLNAHFLLTDTIELSNISTSGACILTTKTLRPGDNILLKIPHDKVSTPLKCTIIWESVRDDVPVCEDIPEPAHQVGVKFNELSTETLVQLKDFMRLAGTPYEQKLSDQYKPSPLRFRITENNQAKVNYPASFPVIKISMGGMLVDTTCDFQIEERHPMALMLPDDDRPVKFLGRIASRIPYDGRFQLGIEFMDMNAYDQSRLGMFLRMLPAVH